MMKNPLPSPPSPCDPSVEIFRDFEALENIGFWERKSAEGLIYWSPSMESLFGLEEGAFDGTDEDVRRRIHPEDLPTFLLARAESIATGKPFPFQFQVRILRSDGAVRLLVVTGMPSVGPDGVLAGGFGLAQDVTDSNISWNENQFLIKVMENMGDGVAAINIQTGLFAYTNPKYEDILGYDPGELIGCHVSVLNPGNPQNSREVFEQIERQLIKGHEWRGTLLNIRKDGQEIWIRASVSSFNHHKFGPVWVEVKSDITQLHAAEQARDEALKSLRGLFNHRREQAELERAALARDVHDHVGAALSGIGMRLEALAHKSQKDESYVRDQLTAIAETAKSTHVTTREICTRLYPIELKDFGLSEACKIYLREWSRTTGLPASGRFGRLPVEPKPRLSNDIFRILQELLTNVARHAGAKRVRVALSSGARHLRLRVVDDGHGFPSAPSKAGFGLLGVRERIHPYEGKLIIDRNKRETAMTVTIPLGAVG